MELLMRAVQQVQNSLFLSWSLKCMANCFQRKFLTCQTAPVM